jgi:polysaccharide transporter, PST family
VKSSIWTFLSVCIRTACSLLINKLFAIHFGTNGLTLLAHFQNLIGMVTVLAGEGLNKGIVKHLADSEIGKEHQVYFFWAGVAVNFIIFLSACLLGVLTYQNFVFKFIGNFTLIGWALLISISLLANLFNLFFVAVVQAHQKFQLFSFLNTLNIVLSTLCIFFSIYYQDLAAALVAYSIGQGLSLLITLPASWKILTNFSLHHLSFSTQLFIDKFKKLSEFIAIGLSIVIFSRLSFYLLREYNIATFGMRQTGLWEAVMRLSEGYTFTFNATFLVIFYPKVSNLVAQPHQLRHYLRQTFLLLLPLIAFALYIIFLFKEYLIVLLFDASFLPALTFLAWVMIGDFFKMISYLLSNVLIAQGKTWLFIILQGIFFSQFFLLIYFLTPKLGALALAVSWVISYVIAVGVLGIILRKIF